MAHRLPPRPFAIATLAVLAGCASVDENTPAIDITGLSPAPIAETPAEAPDTETARIVIYRQFGMEGLMGAAIRSTIRLNDEKIGRCTYGRPIDMEIAPGEYIIDADSEFPNTRKFAIEAGETAYIRCNLTPGLLVPNLILSFVDAETGAQKLAEIRARYPQ